ncbi:MAG TPA: hypothetical protein VHT30_09760 [Acidimicrobiales bacterium]|nr:hypothetical protein [Acidimicrobiales bacterium]
MDNVTPGLGYQRCGSDGKVAAAAPVAAVTVPNRLVPPVAGIDEDLADVGQGFADVFVDLFGKLLD